jgi:hypothetical protein
MKVCTEWFGLFDFGDPNWKLDFPLPGMIDSQSQKCTQIYIGCSFRNFLFSGQIILRTVTAMRRRHTAEDG